MQARIEVLNKGDAVINVWENAVVIRRKNGDVEILHYYLDESGLPRLSENSILITEGKGVVKVKDDATGIEIGTF